MSYQEPSATIQQEFALIPSGITQTQKAVVVGPRRKLIRNSGATRALASYSSYTPLTDVDFDLQGIPVGGQVIAPSVKVIFENVLAEYASKSGSNVIERGASANQIKLGAGSTGGFVASTAGVRNSSFKVRDVQVGDRVIVTPSGLDPFTARITGFLADTVAATVGTFAGDSGNQATATATANSTALTSSGTVVASRAVVLSTASTVFAGDLALGYTSDTYTVECVTSGIGSASVWNVTSVRGDNVAGVAGVALAAQFPIGTKGLSITISGGSTTYALGEKYSITVQAAHAAITPVAVSSSYTGAYDTTYFVEVVKGGTWAQSPQVAVRTSNGVDYGSARTVSAYNSTLPLGSLGATFQIAGGNPAQGGLRLGDIYSVAVTAAAAGEIRTALISAPIPASVVAGDDLSVKFLIYKSSLEIPATGYPEFGDTNWSVDENVLTVKAGIDILDATWKENDNVTQIPVAITSADVHAEYQILETLDANIFGTIGDISLVEATLGEVVPENPLAYGVNKALLNSGGQPVHYVQIDSDDLAGYTNALAVLESEEEAYFLAPQTPDLEIIQTYRAHVESMSSKEKALERILFSARNLETVEALFEKVTGTDTYFTGYVADDGNGAYINVSMPDATFLTSGVRAGDIVRGNYRLDSAGVIVFDTATVNEVTDEQNLVLAAPGFAAPVGSLELPVRLGVFRNLTKDEQAVRIAANSSILELRRVYNVWPDKIVDAAGNTVDGFTVAAAIAGLASSVAPQQGITNYTLNGFSDTLKSSRYFTPTQLNTIAAGGTLIVAQAGVGGEIFIRHQISTDQTDANTAELSITKNLDAIAKFIRPDMKKLIGKYNITTDMLSVGRTLLINKLDYLKNRTKTPTAGPMIVDYDLEGLTIEQDALLRTFVKSRAPITLPYPLNNWDLVLFAQ